MVAKGTKSLCVLEVKLAGVQSDMRDEKGIDSVRLQRMN